ncbi:Class III cytochrome C family protein (plasmid) [Aquisphaera giovannonii]|uniref:Class III cytochrome C family protein n=1 Tax=Aquisphaera giovannonii TaxID=406548 RepID=A0A5B9WH32_9BACT|nr:cytochrome c3 family protein [Aquisphaera giovannonii]QEH39285.1 Class III cytochrome C family protein [Aquisphaera giovannonii]
MPQIFHPSANTLARVSLALLFGGPVGLLSAGYLLMKSPYQTQQRVIKEQPVPFSHEHHVRGLGIDCRYCHSSVEVSANPTVPPTYTCMSCHSQIWSTSPMLEPVRASLRNGQPLKWSKLHNLPDFVYFNHAIHVNKGVGCESCHGRVDLMPLMWKEKPHTMEWCLECHRHPEEQLRPKDAITAMGWEPNSSTGGQAALGKELIRQNHIQVEQLTNCSICHR